MLKHSKQVLFCPNKDVELADVIQCHIRFISLKVRIKINIITNITRGKYCLL